MTVRSADSLQPHPLVLQAAVQSLVPNMVQVLGQALEAGDVDGIKHGFDVLETLLYIVGAWTSYCRELLMLTPTVISPGRSIPHTSSYRARPIPAHGCC